MPSKRSSHRKPAPKGEQSTVPLNDKKLVQEMNADASVGKSRRDVGAFSIPGIGSGDNSPVDGPQQQQRDQHQQRSQNDEAWEEETPVIEAAVAPTDEEIENRMRERILAEAVEAQQVVVEDSDTEDGMDSAAMNNGDSKNQTMRRKSKESLWFWSAVILALLVAGGGVTAVLVILLSKEENDSGGNRNDGPPLPGTQECEENPTCRQNPEHRSPDDSPPQDSGATGERPPDNGDNRDGCRDDLSWIIIPERSNENRYCRPFIFKDTEARCSLQGEDGRLASEACLRTCGTCP